MKSAACVPPTVGHESVLSESPEIKYVDTRGTPMGDGHAPRGYLPVQMGDGQAPRTTVRMGSYFLHGWICNVRTFRWPPLAL